MLRDSKLSLIGYVKWHTDTEEYAIFMDVSAVTWVTYDYEKSIQLKMSECQLLHANSP